MLYLHQNHKNITMKISKIVLIIIIATTTFFSCKKKTIEIENKTVTIKQVEPAIETLKPDAYLKRIKAAEAQIVDVRTAAEFNQGHIENAVNINVLDSSFTKQIINYKKNVPVYVYCTAGGKRSVDATKILKANGFNAINLEGGLVEWAKNEHKVITPIK